jgi:hypothetical protein
MKPTFVVHADWGTHASKRQCAAAAMTANGCYCAFAAEPVGDERRLLERAARCAGANGSALVGFDFPIGVPRAYAEAIGITSFPDFLQGLASANESTFWNVAATPDEISLERPFYPQRPGRTSHRHLLDALGVGSMDDLLRRCDRGYPGRPPASPLFWTLGGKQVGKATISGWRDVLVPGLRSPGLDLALWPFDGSLDSLVRPGRIVLAETYPAEFYRHLGIDFRGRRKTDQSARKANASALLACAADAGVAVDAALESQITSGFPNDDHFDAVVGLFGMLNIDLGRRSSGEPDDEVVRSVEGWMLGQNAEADLPKRRALRRREDLIRRLAEVSHTTWMRQAHRDKGIPREKLPPEVTPHDLERAEDTVRELEQLGLVSFRD